MSGQEFPLSIDRRRMLTSAATVTATGFLPDVNRADAAAGSDFFQSTQLTPKARTCEFFRPNGSAASRNRTSKRASCLCSRLRRNCAG